MKQLKAKYDFKAIEENRYQDWLKADTFKAEGSDSAKMPYSVMIPPPNVTGILHLGHAWDNTIQDILIRHKHLNNFDTLYLPGMDHAGIATQAVVVDRLRKSGINHYELGRKKFQEKAFEWKDEYAAIIREQWESLGLALDYSREKFTLEQSFSDAVKKVFVKLYNDDLLYRGERIINWDVEAQTALSNIEVEHKDIQGKMYTFKYRFPDSDEYLEVATTRPETMFGDVCIVVNPEDERYLDVIGKLVINPANNDLIPIIADDYVELDFGTGAMKCTPAHDPNDFEIGQRHNLELVNCMNKNGTMNDLALQFAGLERFEARKQLVAYLEENDNVVKIEEHLHQVGHSERTGVIVEPYLSMQWFVRMQPLAEAVLKDQEDPETKINFYPKRFENTLQNWLVNIEDWTISRQIWWGHEIPAYYHKETGEVYVAETPPENIDDYIQDPDVLDTWFSSALWPFATLGWPEETSDLEHYFPNGALVTGYDIIFFWVARMAFMSKYLMKERPFKDVVIHGLIRDINGVKMSKSLGNGVNPMDVIAEYGIDALRFFLATNSTPGQDIRYNETKVVAASNFINKLYNASRFVMMNLEDIEITDVKDEDYSLADMWILNRFNETIKEVNNNMDTYEYANAGNAIYHFVWNDFCDYYIELSKAGLNSEDAKVKNATAHTLNKILKEILVMLHPFIPFVTDEIYDVLTQEKIYDAQWPQAVSNINEEAVKRMEQLIEMIKVVRELRVEYNIKPSLNLDLNATNFNNEALEFSELEKAMLYNLARMTPIMNIKGEVISRVTSFGSLNVLASDIINEEAEIQKLNVEIERLNNEIKRSQNMLANENFTKKAPEAKVQVERDKLANYEMQLETVQKTLSEFVK
ncbi:MAG: valine--tRNA ligase [Erysipelothrix sp.]|nr:valine--tRNA ligase [Erysipelothrix sp.]